MPSFTYTARALNGELKTSTIEAASREERGINARYVETLSPVAVCFWECFNSRQTMISATAILSAEARFACAKLLLKAPAQRSQVSSAQSRTEDLPSGTR